jgi:hypothetical protein
MLHKNPNVFETILSPVRPLLNEAAQSDKADSETYKLSLSPFTENLLFGAFSRIKSIGLLVTEIKSSPIAEALNLTVASKSMYSEAFYRYHPESFRNIFSQLLSNTDFLEIPDIKALGRILLVDGSIFPAISTMQWATYKGTANAIKMHLAFELNRMIPVQFLSAHANYSEKNSSNKSFRKAKHIFAIEAIYLLRRSKKSMTKELSLSSEENQICSMTKKRFLMSKFPLNSKHSLKTYGI